MIDVVATGLVETTDVAATEEVATGLVETTDVVATEEVATGLVETTDVAATEEVATGLVETTDVVATEEVAATETHMIEPKDDLLVVNHAVKVHALLKENPENSVNHVVKALDTLTTDPLVI